MIQLERIQYNQLQQNIRTKNNDFTFTNMKLLAVRGDNQYFILDGQAGSSLNRSNLLIREFSNRGCNVLC